MMGRRVFIYMVIRGYTAILEFQSLDVFVQSAYTHTAEWVIDQQQATWTDGCDADAVQRSRVSDRVPAALTMEER